MNSTPLSLSLAFLALTATPAAAQDYTFNHISSENQWTWSASTSLGTLVGQPNNDFDTQGTSSVSLSGSPFSGGQITGASQAVTSDLNGYIPGPFGISFADVNVSNLVFSVTTGPFTIDASGNFTADWVVLFESGTLTVTPLGSGPSVTDLAGTFGPPSTNTGSVTIDSSGQVVIFSNQTATFDFVDAGTGISATFTITGAFRGTADQISSEPGSTFCSGDGSSTACPCGNTGGAGEGCANGTGSGARLSASGTASVSAADLVLSAENLIPSQPGLYFQGNNAVNSGNGNPFGDGLRCAGGGVIRLQVRFADSNGTSQTSANIAANGGVSAGDTKRYQIWYRDPNTSPCSTQFNLSNGYEITWAS